jgi:hypothetical protein
LIVHKVMEKVHGKRVNSLHVFIFLVAATLVLCGYLKLTSTDG